VKGYLTVNTSSLNQAILGGILIKNEHSLLRFNQGKVDSMQVKRDTILLALRQSLDVCLFPWAKDIRWSTPGGGFFLRIQVPFPVDKNEVVVCAEQFGVIFTPMSFFYMGSGGENEIRLAFSYVTTDQIHEGIRRLALYLKFKTDNK
jgi:(S)-3,5-dihydroxyphenylglycine transaminase